MNNTARDNPSHLGLLRIEGIDAKKFLQGQLTCNVDEVTDDAFRLGAHCNPQGRIISLFRLFLFKEAYYLLMPSSLVAVAEAALKKYAVFFKVKLEAVNDLASHPELKQKIADLFSPDSKIFSENEWKKLTIANNIPEIYPETTEKFLPHDINLPELNGVSFNKGCYTGQEIIARMQYRGKLKTHLYQAKTTSATQPNRGDEIYTEEGPAGNIVDFASLPANQFQLLITAKESDIGSKPFFLDNDKKIPLDI